MRRVPKTLASWLNCQRCRLHRHRKNVVLGRGVMPAPLLLIGIGPGVAEDALGRAFVGPSGRLLDRGLEDAAEKVGRDVPRHYMVNLLACRPCDSLGGDNRDPMPDEVVACRPRLAETVSLVRPEKIVLLGDVVRAEAQKHYPDAACLHHPAFVLRRGGRVSVDYTTFVRGLTEVIASLDIKQGDARDADVQGLRRGL